MATPKPPCRCADPQLGRVSVTTGERRCAACQQLADERTLAQVAFQRAERAKLALRRKRAAHVRREKTEATDVRARWQSPRVSARDRSSSPDRREPDIMASKPSHPTRSTSKTAADQQGRSMKASAATDGPSPSHARVASEERVSSGSSSATDRERTLNASDDRATEAKRHEAYAKEHPQTHVVIDETDNDPFVEERSAGEQRAIDTAPLARSGGEVVPTLPQYPTAPQRIDPAPVRGDMSSGSLRGEADGSLAPPTDYKKGSTLDRLRGRGYRITGDPLVDKTVRVAVANAMGEPFVTLSAKEAIEGDANGEKATKIERWLHGNATSEEIVERAKLADAHADTARTPEQRKAAAADAKAKEEEDKRTASKAEFDAKTRGPSAR